MRALPILLLTFAAALPSAAQDLPRPYASGETRGRVVDEAGAGVEGAVVVARWNRLDYVSKLEGSGYYYGGAALHIGEAVTDRDGRYAIAGWGPAMRIGSTLEEGAPLFLVFKSGYEPSAGHDANVRLRGKSGEPAAYAQHVRNFQERSLAWNYPGDNWKSMPRMVEALQADKARAPVESGPILGAHTLPGRSGAGRVVDAKTGERITTGDIAIDWTLRRADRSPGTRRFVETKRLGSNRYVVQFYVSPFRMPAPRVPGWEIDPEVRPDIAIYVPGYEVYREPKWGEGGGTIRLDPLPPGREAHLGNLRTWRRDIDRALALGDRDSALEGARVLLLSFEYQCASITPDLRKGLCFEPESPTGLFIARARVNPVMVVETHEGIEVIRVVSAGPGVSASAAAGGRTSYSVRAPVGGFSIEPVKR